MRQMLALLFILMWTFPLQAQFKSASYYEALRLIKVAELNGAIELDLSRMSLGELPPEIGLLSNLQHLNLWDTKIRNLPPEIGQLTNLESLDLGANRLTSLPVEIQKLGKLQSLNLYSNEFNEFPTIVLQLSSLEKLDLCYNQLSELPTQISQLTALSHLTLCHNQLTNLPAEIGLLANLCDLDLNYNDLTYLPDLGDLDKFTELTVSESCRGMYYGLRLFGNPLSSPPPEVVDGGTPVILAYLRNPALWHLERLLIFIAQGISFLTLVVLGLRWRRNRNYSKKKKRE